jgi:hypothetical protein
VFGVCYTFVMKRSLIVSVVSAACLILLVLIALTVRQRMDTNTLPIASTPPTGTAKKYERIDVWSLDESQNYGSVWVEEREIRNNVSVKDISNYIAKNKSEWEGSEQEYQTGGMDEFGNLWDILATTSIGKKDFLIPVWIQIDDEFSSDYYVDLVETQ